MKEKIQLLSRGVFEYENPEIEVSEKEIALEVEAGSHYSGTIQLNSRNHIEIRAMIFSSVPPVSASLYTEILPLPVTYHCP